MINWADIVEDQLDKLIDWLIVLTSISQIGNAETTITNSCNIEGKNQERKGLLPMEEKIDGIEQKGRGESSVRMERTKM